MLPRPPRSARVVGGIPGWRDALREAGIAVTDQGEGGPAPDLVVADRRSAREALADGAGMVILEGGSIPSAPAGLHVERYLPWPGPEAPEILIPVDRPRAARYAVREWTVPVRRWKRLRNHLLVQLLERRTVPPLRPLLSVGVDQPGPPYIVAAAAREFGLPAPLDWFVTLGEGDALTRGVFHLFAPGAAEPGWALKFARTPGNTEPFERDERSLELAREAGGPVAAHAPRLLGRLEVDGRPASLESAAVGRRMNLILRSPGDSRGKVRAIEAVAAWLLEVARSTAAGPEALGPELRRLAEGVLPRWRDAGVDLALAHGIGGVPAVFEHRDLGSWNVIAGSHGFTAVDWESSIRHGFPLWDALYFLTDALAHLDGASPLERRPEYAARLHRGELPSSQLLFSWLRRIVDALAIPVRAVGPLATLCWLHHGLSHLSRRAAGQSAASDASALPPYLDGIARRWLTDPALGPGWEAWRGS